MSFSARQPACHPVWPAPQRRSERRSGRGWARATTACGLALCIAAVTGTASAQSSAADVEAGLRILNDVSSGNCAGCHALPGQPGLQSSFGPPLAGVAQRMGTEELRQWIADARRLRPGTLMPPFGTVEGLNRINPNRPILTPQQIEQVIAALQSLR